MGGVRYPTPNRNTTHPNYPPPPLSASRFVVHRFDCTVPTGGGPPAPGVRVDNSSLCNCDPSFPEVALGCGWGGSNGWVTRRVVSTSTWLIRGRLAGS
eukprot:757760-Hanusia_phi.AAC.5